MPSLQLGCSLSVIVHAQAVPSRTIWRRPLMVRQPYSVAVPSTGGRLHPRFLRFLSTGNGGTEGGVKTIEEGLGEKVELSLQERRRGRKKPFLMGKSDANECNESSLSNCRVQLALSTKKDGMILETCFDQ